MSKYTIITAIIAIMFIELYAISQGINGDLLKTVVFIISGLGIGLVLPQPKGVL